ncbi:hypothetical protein STEG23_023232, partial [Scotinomys teguina]
MPDEQHIACPVAPVLPSVQRKQIRTDDEWRSSQGPGKPFPANREAFDVWDRIIGQKAEIIAVKMHREFIPVAREHVEKATESAGHRGWDGSLALTLLDCGNLPASSNDVPQVTVQPMSTVQKLGGTVILGCVVEPPWVNVTWRFNGKELSGPDDALGVLVTRGTLVIAALNNHTVGRYQCVARIPAGAVASVPATVTLA